MRSSCVDRRLEAIAGAPVMQVAAPTRVPLPPVGTTVIFVGRYQYSADITSGRQMTISANPQYGYITGVPPEWITVLPASQRGIEGSLVWAWVIVQSNTAANLGLGSHATLGSYSPWVGAMRAVTYNTALPAALIMRVVRWLAQQLPAG